MLRYKAVGRRHHSRRRRHRRATHSPVRRTAPPPRAPRMRPSRRDNRHRAMRVPSPSPCLCVHNTFYPYAILLIYTHVYALLYFSVLAWPRSTIIAITIT